MRLKDIVVGQDYAVGRMHFPKRATVVATGLQRTRWDGWRNVRTDRDDGVEVRYANGSTDVIAAQRVHRTWADQEDADGARERNRIAVEQERDRRNGLMEDARGVLDAAGIASVILSHRLTLSPDEAAKLAALLRALP